MYNDMENFLSNDNFWQQAEAYVAEIKLALQHGLAIDEIIIDSVERAKSEAIRELQAGTSDATRSQFLNQFIGQTLAIEDLLRAAGS